MRMSSLSRAAITLIILLQMAVATPAMARERRVSLCTVLDHRERFEGKEIVFRGMLSVELMHGSVFIDRRCKHGLLAKGITDERFARQMKPFLYSADMLGPNDVLAATFTGVVKRQRSLVHPSGEEYFIDILEMKNPRKERRT
jgi:hypothetical protein